MPKCLWGEFLLNQSRPQDKWPLGCRSMQNKYRKSLRLREFKPIYEVSPNNFAFSNNRDSLVCPKRGSKNSLYLLSGKAGGIMGMATSANYGTSCNARYRLNAIPCAFRRPDVRSVNDRKGGTFPLAKRPYT
jgi:hypothetical protein